ncbi:hypothetical protein X943_001582 [Babesia divergens]|uniref:Uncharacterized protein n=1 Tax=Babesia divergens TaxID=32595 RepID=A0AAD9GCZ1_BABDI|nr:hypothetical protein X943_001582 [Babesia divergens]
MFWLTSCSTLDAGMASMVDHISSRRHIRDHPVRLAIISPPSQTLVHLISVAFRQERVTIALLPIDFSLLVRRLANEPVSSFNKHVVDNWRSLIVEAGIDALLTTADYYELVGPICDELTLPLYLATAMPAILARSEYEAAIKAGHGYVDFLNIPRPGYEYAPAEPLPRLISGNNVDKLHIFSEIGSCNAKAAIHTASTLQAAFERISILCKLEATDSVLNCLFPHEYAYVVYGVLYALNANAKIHCPLTVVPSSNYTKLKVQFPLTSPYSMHDTLLLTLGKSVFDYVRSCNCNHTVLMCDAQTFRMLVAFITCGDLSQSEKCAYLRGWQLLERIFVFEDASKLFDKSLVEEALAFLEATSLKVPIVQVYTLSEAGAVSYMTLSDKTSTLIQLPGCNIEDNGEEFTVSACTDSLFKEYHKRARATAEARAEGTLRLTFRKHVNATRLLKNHADYVTYFKRRRERMSRYPQGYIKKVPVRTQFWGNFTGKHKHHSVL